MVSRDLWSWKTTRVPRAQPEEEVWFYQIPGYATETTPSLIQGWSRMGGGAQNDYINHMKDIHEVQDIQPRPFIDNHIHWSGVAGSVHLIYWMDRKLGQKGGVRTHPQQQHPVPQERPFSIKCWPTTGCPQTMPQKTKEHQNACCECHSTTHTHTHTHTMICNPLPSRVEQHHLHTVTNLSHTDSLSSRQTVPAIPPGSSTSSIDRPGFGLALYDPCSKVAIGRSHIMKLLFVHSHFMNIKQWKLTLNCDPACTTNFLSV